MKKRLFPLLLGVLLAAGMLGCAPAADQLSPAASPDEEDEAPAAAGYADALFDTSYVHKIDVEIAEEHWKDLLENPTEKTKYPANVTIDGNAVDNVSFATKGNTSLTQVAATDSDRYSFKINFVKFVDGKPTAAWTS